MTPDEPAQAAGRVTLIGAGPGDPDLLTVRAVKRLAAADLILYDALSSPAARELAPEARWFFVGKRSGRDSFDQETINRILIREARRGRHVVRFKSGDPFVLGRGGEEALALIEAGIPLEVVPGITTALAAPGLFGIPVTHRGLASSFVVFSGHALSAWAPLLDSLAPGSATLVCMMGLRVRDAIAARLLARGWPAQTPVAVLLGAGTPLAARWIGTLDTLAGAALPVCEQPAPPAFGLINQPPGTIVIGEVVNLARTIAPPVSGSS